MIIAFDFDGTITKQNEYPKCGLLREGIVECIRKLKEEGNYIIIFTCRDVSTNSQANAYIDMLIYLNRNCIPFDAINNNINPNTNFNPKKPYWNILVDDSALGFNKNWTGEDIYNMIKNITK